MPITKPVRFPSGVSGDSPSSINADFPQVLGRYQYNYLNTIALARSTDFTSTIVGTGTVTNTAWPGGMMTITNTAGAADAITLGHKTQGMQILPGNRFWMNATIAMPLSGVAQTMYLGGCDATTFGAATNGIWLFKAAASSSLSLVIKNGATTTTFTNIADLSKTSGWVNDTSAVAGTLAFNGAGTTFATVTVNNPGSGYQVSPFVIPTGTAGSGAQVYCQIGSGQLYAPYIAAAGSGYTAGTLGATILPLHNIALYYDGKGTLFVGVNGKTVISIGTYGATSVTAGATVTNAAYNSYIFTKQLSTGVAPIQPRAGSFENLSALVPMFPSIALVNTSAVASTMYVNEIEFAGDLS